MTDLLCTVINRICDSNPMHGKKIIKNLRFFDQEYYQKVNIFLNKYIRFLSKQGKSIEYGVDCYLKMCRDMMLEQIKFMETGAYSSSSFEEVLQRVYGNPEIMEYYMHGLLLSQFLWVHHYKIFSFFIDSLRKYGNGIRNYLEVGGGHGLFISEAIEILGNEAAFDLVDISKSSIEISKNFIENEKVNYILHDIFTFTPKNSYNFITMGEVLEHVENPIALLSKVRNLLVDDGYIFITVPANGPAIDHIYLFRNINEIREIIRIANLKILDEMCVCSEDIDQEKAEKLGVTLMFAALLRK